MLGVLAGICVSLIAVGTIGNISWNAKVASLADKLPAEPRYDRNPTVNTYLSNDATGPVEKYFSSVLVDGEPPIAKAVIHHSGSFNMGQDDEQWHVFKSVQHVMLDPPGFVWNAKIRMVPGVPARVIDAYIDGDAVLTGKLLGLITVMELPNSPELAEGELMRFVAEAAWYPTALLRPNVSWEPIDLHTARVTLTDKSTTVSLEVRFSDDNLISSIYSEGRFRDVDGVQVKTPWEGRFWNYEERGGMMIPLDGEVAWILPSGRKPYWRGHMDVIEYIRTDA